MAYNLSDRFSSLQSPFRLFDPGAYQYEDSSKKIQNKYPFLSNTPRNTQTGRRIWTHNLYNTEVLPKIPNCTAFKSRLPRFSYKPFSSKDWDAILCRCGISNTCECLKERKENLTTVNCQGKINKTLFIAAPSRSFRTGALTCPSKTDHIFEKQSKGSKKRINDNDTNKNPPFYDRIVNESTAFYQGCKWSKWTSKSSIKSIENKPGPAEYDIIPKITLEKKCAENFRHQRRKTAKQLRYIELLQQKNIYEDRPGPGSYNPTFPITSNFKYSIAKSVRFPLSNNRLPGATHYWIRRTFDPPKYLRFHCHVKLPKRASFGIKDQRFKELLAEGPSPVSYFPNYKPCLFRRYSQVPFGCSSERFKNVDVNDTEIQFSQKCDDMVEDNSYKNLSQHQHWMFKSKTARMKKFKTKHDEPSPADLPQARIKVVRSRQLQYLAPFFSSDGRFQPWNNWIPVHGRLNTPGPCYYNLNKLKSTTSAVHRGPLVRTARYPNGMFHTPAPNKYKIGGGIETILSTHNQRLKNNVQEGHIFHWKQPEGKKILTILEKEAQLLQKSILLLEHGYDEESSM